MPPGDWNDRHRAPCPVCGQPMRAGSVKSIRRPTCCLECRHLSRAEARDRRGVLIEGLWAEGLSQREIGERIGWSRGAVAREIHRLRKLGYDLPFRRKVGSRLQFEFESFRSSLLTR